MTITTTQRHTKTKRSRPILKLLHCSLTNDDDKNRLRLEVHFMGKRKQRFYSPLKLERVLDLCNRQNAAIERGEGLLAEITKEVVHRHIGIEEALVAWVQSLIENERNATYIKNSQDAAKVFLTWLKKSYPSPTTWNSLARRHVEAYHKHLESRGIARDTVIANLKPIRGTAALVTDQLGSAVCPDVFKAAKITIKAKPRPQSQILNSGGLMRFLAWLQTNNAALYNVAMITGLSGLRVLEATALRFCDVDFERGTITVTETDQHKPKNAGSHRTIPVCDMLLDFLQSKCNGQPADSVQTICKSVKGLPLNLETTAYKNTAKRAIVKARAAGIVPQGFKFHELRASFATIAQYEARIDRHDLEKYVGHSATTVLDRHYIRIEFTDQRRLTSDRLNGVFREHFVNTENTNIKAACVMRG